LSPETTADREGFVHPVSITGGMESASIQFIIRDFETAKLKVHEQFVEDTANQIIKNYPGSTFDIEITNQYRNMKEVLLQNPQLVSYAEEAIRRAGMNPVSGGIRGGTDGSRLSFMGLPCPNIFAGEHAFHSKLEWVSVQDMELAVDTIINLVQIW
jgi:tripeptide aminopeptidase